MQLQSEIKLSHYIILCYFWRLAFCHTTGNLMDGSVWSSYPHVQWRDARKGEKMQLTVTPNLSAKLLLRQLLLWSVNLKTTITFQHYFQFLLSNYMRLWMINYCLIFQWQCLFFLLYLWIWWPMTLHMYPPCLMKWTKQSCVKAKTTSVSLNWLCVESLLLCQSQREADVYSYQNGA